METLDHFSGLTNKLWITFYHPQLLLVGHLNRSSNAYVQLLHPFPQPSAASGLTLIGVALENVSIVNQDTNLLLQNWYP